MTHGRLTELFLKARELPASERDDFLDRACDGDPDLRGELNSLLSHDRDLSPTMSVYERETATSAAESSGARLRFLPGTMVAGRYRIVALLGRGGMGEVYRADDLTLDQPVALKFLPRAMQDDPDRLDRMLNEVRLSRQISHAGVCRVFDVGEAGDEHFFTMEYVDGEDLHSLLHRIGRLPRDRAVQIARQLVAGLAAAHERRILHRDIKPANIMIDGHGRPKITDFGLAALPEEVAGRDVGLGTPAYMAPEQFAGDPVTERSDLYSLGLVLYELFTGKRAFPADTVEELRGAQGTTPVEPSVIVEGFDPVVECAILQCLAPDPRDRPVSALALLAALPGGDPLAAALRAGETPSPELVAAAEAETRLTPTVGVACFVVTLLGLLVLAGLSDRIAPYSGEPLELAPPVLVHEARQVLGKLGGSPPLDDSARGFGFDGATLARREVDSGAGRFPAIHFWYRASSAPLRAEGGKVDLTTPSIAPGMSSVVLSSDGRLLEYLSVPASIPEPGTPDWEAGFRLAGLDFDRFQRDSEADPPPVRADTRATWLQRGPADGENPIRVRAGAVGERLTYFQVLPPWRESLLTEAPRGPKHLRSSRGLYDGLYVIVVLACVLVARHNLRRGRGDRRGATRLAVYVFGVMLASGLLAAHHIPDAQSARYIAVYTTGNALFAAVFLCWLPYVALEPSLRRAWPYRIVSWTRLLAGQIRDSLVGRDLMIGVLTAVGTQLLLRIYAVAPGWLGRVPPRPDESWPEVLLGLRYGAAAFLRLQPTAIFFGLGLLFLLLGFRVLTRRLWIAAPVLIGLATLAWYPEVSTLYPEIGLLVTALRIATFVFVLLRFGVLAGIVALFFDGVLNVFPLTLDLSAFYCEVSLFAMATAVATATWGLRHALAGRFPARAA